MTIDKIAREIIDASLFGQKSPQEEAEKMLVKYLKSKAKEMGVSPKDLIKSLYTKMK